MVPVTPCKGLPDLGAFTGPTPRGQPRTAQALYFFPLTLPPPTDSLPGHIFRWSPHVCHWSRSQGSYVGMERGLFVGLCMGGHGPQQQDARESKESCPRVPGKQRPRIPRKLARNWLHPSCVASGAPGVEEHRVEAPEQGFQSVLWSE